MARKFRAASGASAGAKGNRILLVDDQDEYLEANRLLLENEGHSVIVAHNGDEALAVLRKTPVDLVLLDFFMPGMTGEQVVENLRTFNLTVQVILQTGYASEKPARELLRRLDIQGFHDKSDGPEKFLMWTDVGLKAAKQLSSIAKSRQGMQRILQATPQLHRVQPLGDLLHSVLHQLCELIEAQEHFLPAIPPDYIEPEDLSPRVDGFLTLLEPDTGMLLHVGMDSLVELQHDPATLPQALQNALDSGKILVDETSTTVPLRIGSTVLGAICVHRRIDLSEYGEILPVFANQAAVAIQNAQLYEMATLDPLTGTNMRRLFEPSLLRELRHSLQASSPLSLLMLDLDGLKKINDTGGHAAGDSALAAFGKVLRRCLRAGDSVWRFGGDEFTVILPYCNPEMSQKVAERILGAMESESVHTNSGDLPLHASVGGATLDTSLFPIPTIPRQLPISYFQEMLHYLVQCADDELYKSKKGGKFMVHHAGYIPWRTPADV